MKTDTLLTLGLIAAGGYVVYRLTKPVENAAQSTAGAIENIGKLAKPAGTLGDVLSSDIQKANDFVVNGISGAVSAIKNVVSGGSSGGGGGNKTYVNTGKARDTSTAAIYTPVQQAQIKNVQSGNTYANIAASILGQSISVNPTKASYMGMAGGQSINPTKASYFA